MNELTPDEHNIIVDAIHDSAIVIHKGQRMNERIKEIASQVLDELVPETWVALGYDKIKEIQFRTAELIVRECIDKITTYDLVPGHSAKWEDIYDIHTRLLQDLGEELKEHFGVTK